MLLVKKIKKVRITGVTPKEKKKSIILNYGNWALIRNRAWPYNPY